MDQNKLPKISILIAARNEEKNISRCLSAILELDYPSDKMEILLGNDNSEDNTESIVNSFIAGNNNLRLIQIKKGEGNLKGKANVLNQLASNATGEIFLITDADIKVLPTWAIEMVSHMGNSYDIVSPGTAIEGDSLFAQLQNADLVYYYKMGHMQSKAGKPVTARGSNMAIRASVYFAVGGYEKIPFSVMEDYALTKAVLNAGYKFKDVLEPATLNFSTPMKSLRDLLRQRKRWFKGAFSMPRPFVVALVIQCISLPFLIALGLIWGWYVPVGILLIRWCIDLYIISKTYKSLNLSCGVGAYAYTPFRILFNFIFLVNTVIPTQVNWKDRRF